VNLTTLACSFCPSLLSIPPSLINAVNLYCYHCPLLLAAPPGLHQWSYAGCPWLPQNATAYPTHLPSLLRIKRWFRAGRKQSFKRWIRTRAFNEWIFHPDRIGGKLVKRQMEAELGAMRPAKKQRVE
jgi:hypothetical protein